MIPRDIHRDISREARQAVQQNTRLDAAAAAVFDQQGVRTDQRGHLCGIALHDRCLRARRVVLGKLADLIEQSRAVSVVKVLAGERLLKCRQTCEHFRFEAFHRGGTVVQGGRKRFHRAELSFANRIPVNCQRASGGKKFR